MKSQVTVKTRTFSLYPTVKTPGPDADSERDSISIGQNRQLILLCAWIACVFTFAIVAARMFYGAGTTGDLNAATGLLRPTPVAEYSKSLSDQHGDRNVIRPVSHSVFAGYASPIPASSPDAYYGQVPSAPTTTRRPDSEQQSASDPRKPSPSEPKSFSVFPPHALNRTAEPDRSPIEIPPEDRKSDGPSWSILPGRPPQLNFSDDLSIFSQWPKYRKPESTDGAAESPSVNAPTPKKPELNQEPETEAGEAIPNQLEQPNLKRQPAARRSETPRTIPPQIPYQIEGPSQTDWLRARSISATNRPDDILQLPATPINRLPTPRRFEAPVRIPATGNPSVEGTPPSGGSGIDPTHDSLASGYSGWSNFAAAPVMADAMWWESEIAGSLFPNRQPMNLTLAACLSIAQTNSPELQVLHSDWYIQQAEADRLAAAFDWNTFVEAIWNRDSAPVGSDLDGATDRLRSRTANSSFGVRRLTESGAELEISQQFGTRSGNSIFLDPNPQAVSRLSLDYKKPLLRGFGEDYNTSPQKLATINRDTAYDRFRVGVQDYLLNVASAYWSVVLQRGLYLQAQASLGRVQKIANEMVSRIEVDVTPGMLDRARSEVAIRKANLVKVRHDVLRAQSGLLRLIHGAEFNRFANHEVVTGTLPMPRSGKVQPDDNVQLALQQRSEVHQAIREIKAATIRYEVAANEVLPALNLVLSGYVAGLDAGDDIGTSWGSQFREGEPGVGIGFDFEIPYRNRAAEAAAERQQITIKRMQAALQTVLADVGEDVRNQVIERNKYGAMLGDQQEAIRRARSMLKNATIRRELLADGNQVADLYLEDLLQIQNRVESTERAFLQSQVRYTLADNALLRAIAGIDSLAGNADQAVTTSIIPVPTTLPTSAGHSFNQ